MPLVYMKEMEITRQEKTALVEEKYGGNDRAPGLTEDLARLAQGEPLAYVIGHIPFLGVSVHLDSHPLIPRPETEWWTEELVKRIGSAPLSVLDLCAGSGAIGLALLKHCPQVKVSFGEVVPEHSATIEKNITSNALDRARAVIRISDLFATFTGERYDIIATNPPYIPASRSLDTGVTAFEPHEALYAGEDGLTLIRRMVSEAKDHLTSQGELWMECDIANIQEAAALAREAGFRSVTIRTDLYGRERLVVAQL